MKFKTRELLETAIREGTYIGLAKTYPANALLTIDHPAVIDNVTTAVLARLAEIIDFENDSESDEVSKWVVALGGHN